MDAKGSIYEFTKRQAERRELELRVGPLEPIPPAELEQVRAMTVPERVAWYGDKRAKRAQRRRERAARKRGRRERGR